MYHDGSRQLQDQFDSRRIADRIQSISNHSLEAVTGVEQIAQSVVDLHRQAQQLWALAARFSSAPARQQEEPPL